MLDFLENHYLLLKSLHIIFVTFWMAGMFYLPRLFVYHTAAKPQTDLDETLKIMERRLARGIILPAMLLTLLTGMLLLFVPGLVDWHDGWLHFKLFCVLLLLILHGYLSRARRRFAQNNNKNTGTFYRIINEVPPLIFIIIVLLVVLKPA